MSASTVPTWTTREVAVVAACTAATLGLGIWIGARLATPPGGRGPSPTPASAAGSPALTGAAGVQDPAAGGAATGEATLPNAEKALVELTCSEVCQWMADNGASQAVLACFREKDVGGTDVADVLEEGFGLSVADKVAYLGVPAAEARSAATLLVSLAKQCA